MRRWKEDMVINARSIKIGATERAYSRTPGDTSSKLHLEAKLGVPGGTDVSEEKQEDKVYISFVLFSKHWKGPMAEKSVSALCMFRNYLHYHIKASKAFMHMRMRKRADDLLQVLNRAKPPAEGVVERKTWQGKTVHAQ